MSPQVSSWLENLAHPFHKEINQVRQLLLQSHPQLLEDIKWNAPNYTLHGEDRITLRVLPPKKQVQIIFHRGAKKLAMPNDKLIENASTLLVWKTNDRAIATFNSAVEIGNAEKDLLEIAKAWLQACEG